MCCARFALALQDRRADPRGAARKSCSRRSNFDRGCQTVEYIASALVDLDLHLLKPSTTLDIDAFEPATLDRIGMPEEIAMRHRPPHFTHVFSGGYYASAYYSYMWSEVLDADALSRRSRRPATSSDPATASG